MNTHTHVNIFTPPTYICIHMFKAILTMYFDTCEFTLMLLLPISYARFILVLKFAYLHLFPPTVRNLAPLFSVYPHLWRLPLPLGNFPCASTPSPEWMPLSPPLCVVPPCWGSRVPAGPLPGRVPLGPPGLLTWAGGPPCEHLLTLQGAVVTGDTLRPQDPFSLPGSPSKWIPPCSLRPDRSGACICGHLPRPVLNLTCLLVCLPHADQATPLLSSPNGCRIELFWKVREGQGKQNHIYYFQVNDFKSLHRGGHPFPMVRTFRGRGVSEQSPAWMAFPLFLVFYHH